MPRLFDPITYGPVIAVLLADDHLSPLGPGRPREHVRPLLASFDPATAFAPHAVHDPSMAAACHAGLWLYHDFLDESHTLSQGIDTPTGSYWHGIMHRREPDAGNAAYWFRRVGRHPVFEPLADHARRLGLTPRSAAWDPFAFIDLCDGERGTNSPRESLLCQVQRCEWDLLFDWCFHRATGTSRINKV